MLSRWKFVKKIVVILSVVLIGVVLVSIFLFSHPKQDDNEQDIPVNQEETNSDVKTAKLTFVGDLLFESAYYNAINQGEDQDLYFSLVKNYFKQDDLSVGNMEVVIGNEEIPVNGGDNYNFAAPSWVGDLVSSLGFEVLSTANNHAFDQGSKGVISTIDYFQNHSDIMTVGTFKNKEDVEELSILEVNGIRFGFLSYTMGTNVKMSSDEEYMVSLFKSNYSTTVTEEDKEKMKEQILTLKENVDVTIILMHWGSEYTFTPNETQKDLALFFNSLGVDIVVGNHSHNIQPIEWVGDEHKTLVYYSLGNFVSADGDIPRTTQTFNNAYQIGLLSQLTVTKENDTIKITDITTDAIINYYDANLRHFQLIPYQLYTNEYEVNHYRYQQGFTKDFILSTYQSVIPEEFRSI